MQNQSQDDVLFTSTQLRRRWGSCSDMLLWRRLRDDPNMPKPLIMHRRRFWRLSEICRYENSIQRDSAPAPEAA